MTREREVLIIGTYGIDVFHGVIEAMEKRGNIVFTATTQQITKEYLQNRRFDAIIINLEPDGHGGVAESELLSMIVDSRLQGDAVCLGVSAHFPHSLPSSKSDKHLQILAGWLTLPVKAEVLSNHIIKLLDSPERETVRRLSAAQ